MVDGFSSIRFDSERRKIEDFRLENGSIVVKRLLPRVIDKGGMIHTRDFVKRGKFLFCLVKDSL